MIFFTKKGCEEMYQPYSYVPQQRMYPQGIKGRVVGTVDEVKAAQIDLDGSATYFPCPAEQTIYVKSIDLNGIPSMLVYKLEKQAEPVKYATSTDLEAVNRKIAEIENMIKGGGESGHNASTTND